MELLSYSQELHLLPGRFGPRPRSSDALPFRQLDQFPPAELQHRLFEMCFHLPGVRSRQSRLATPQSRALCLTDLAPSGPSEAFIDGREFCHLHALPEGSIHLMLPRHVVECVVALGWAERHPAQKLGLFKNLVLVYGPRDRAELEIVFSLIEHSCRFARGEGQYAVMPVSAHAVV
jgi:phospholipase/carboxylesterase